MALGYDGSYGRVAAFARDWKSRPAAGAADHRPRRPSCRWSFAPAKPSSSTGREDWALIAGERTKLQVAHSKLSHSRVFIVRAYLLQTHEMLFDAHNHAFRVLGGVPQRGIYDNMRTAVDRIGRGQGAAGQRPLCRHGQPLSCSRRISAIRPRAGRRGKLRRTCRMPGIGSGSRLPSFPRPGCAQRLAGGTLH